MPTTTDARLVLACRRVELRMTQGLLVDAWHDNGRWHYRTPTGNGTSLEPVRLPGLLLFMVWMAAMGAAMLRAKPVQV